MYPVHCCAKFSIVICMNLFIKSVVVCIYCGLLHNFLGIGHWTLAEMPQRFQQFFCPFQKNCDGICNGILSQNQIVMEIRHNIPS